MTKRNDQEGILEAVLRDRYGEPRVVACDAFVEYRWNDDVESMRSVLYKKPGLGETCGEHLNALRAMYGDAVGGSLLRGSLKVAMLEGPKLFHLYQIDDLQAHPEVLCANDIDVTISFFMDSANVWYYGLRGDELWVWDSETGELYSRGPARTALEELIGEWEEAGK